MAEVDDLRRYGDALEGEARRRFLQMVNALDEANMTGIMVDIDLALRTGDLTAIQLAAQRMVAQGLIPASLDFINVSYLIMARSGLATVGADLALELSDFILNTVRTVAMSRGDQRVTGIATDTARNMRLIMEDAVKRGVGAEQLGRELRSSIGLLPRHSIALQNYGQEMERRGIPETKRVQLYNKYRQRLINWRAEMISRTETMYAVHAGQMAGWVAQIRAGIILPERTRIEWVVTEDDRLCDRCAPMDGKQVQFGEEFVADERGFPDGIPPHADSPYDRKMDRRGPLRPPIPVAKGVELKPMKPIRVYHPPLHPNCRCTLKLVFGNPTVS